MPRRLCVFILSLLTLASSAADTLACGDKFLRVGRSARIRGYASVHPSSILVYAPKWTRRGVADFERTLKRAGHTPLTVTTEAEMSQAFAAQKYNVVISSYSDTDAVRKALEPLPSRPSLLPLMYKVTKAQAAEAEATYRCLLKPETMTPFQALEEIDRVIDLRLKETGPARTAR